MRKVFFHGVRKHPSTGQFYAVFGEKKRKKGDGRNNYLSPLLFGRGGAYAWKSCCVVCDGRVFYLLLVSMCPAWFRDAAFSLGRQKGSESLVFTLSEVPALLPGQLPQEPCAAVLGRFTPDPGARQETPFERHNQAERAAALAKNASAGPATLVRNEAVGDYELVGLVFNQACSKMLTQIFCTTVLGALLSRKKTVTARTAAPGPPARPPERRPLLPPAGRAFLDLEAEEALSGEDEESAGTLSPQEEGAGGVPGVVRRGLAPLMLLRSAHYSPRLTWSATGFALSSAQRQDIEVLVRTFPLDDARQLVANLSGFLEPTLGAGAAWSETELRWLARRVFERMCAACPLFKTALYGGRASAAFPGLLLRVVDRFTFFYAPKAQRESLLRQLQGARGLQLLLNFFLPAGESGAKRFFTPAGFEDGDINLDGSKSTGEDDDDEASGGEEGDGGFFGSVTPRVWGQLSLTLRFYFGSRLGSRARDLYLVYYWARGVMLLCKRRFSWHGDAAVSGDAAHVFDNATTSGRSLATRTAGGGGEHVGPFCFLFFTGLGVELDGFFWSSLFSNGHAKAKARFFCRPGPGFDTEYDDFFTGKGSPSGPTSSSSSPDGGGDRLVQALGSSLRQCFRQQSALLQELEVLGGGGDDEEDDPLENVTVPLLLHPRVKRGESWSGYEPRRGDCAAMTRAAPVDGRPPKKQKTAFVPVQGPGRACRLPSAVYVPSAELDSRPEGARRLLELQQELVRLGVLRRLLLPLPPLPGPDRFGFYTTRGTLETDRQLHRLLVELVRETAPLTQTHPAFYGLGSCDVCWEKTLGGLYLNEAHRDAGRSCREALTESQKAALRGFIGGGGVCLLEAPAGTGKSAVTALLSALGRRLPISCHAITCRAAWSLQSQVLRVGEINRRQGEGDDGGGQWCFERGGGDSSSAAANGLCVRREAFKALPAAPSSRLEEAGGVSALSGGKTCSWVTVKAAADDFFHMSPLLEQAGLEQYLPCRVARIVEGYLGQSARASEAAAGETPAMVWVVDECQLLTPRDCLLFLRSMRHLYGPPAAVLFLGDAKQAGSPGGAGNTLLFLAETLPKNRQFSLHEVHRGSNALVQQCAACFAPRTRQRLVMDPRAAVALWRGGRAEADGPDRELRLPPHISARTWGNIFRSVTPHEAVDLVAKSQQVTDTLTITLRRQDRGLILGALGGGRDLDIGSQVYVKQVLIDLEQTASFAAPLSGKDLLPPRYMTHREWVVRQKTAMTADSARRPKKGAEDLLPGRCLDQQQKQTPGAFCYHSYFSTEQAVFRAPRRGDRGTVVSRKTVRFLQKRHAGGTYLVMVEAGCEPSSGSVTACSAPRSSGAAAGFPRGLRPDETYTRFLVQLWTQGPQRVYVDYLEKSSIRKAEEGKSAAAEPRERAGGLVRGDTLPIEAVTGAQAATSILIVPPTTHGPFNVRSREFTYVALSRAEKRGLVLFLSKNNSQRAPPRDPLDLARNLFSRHILPVTTASFLSSQHARRATNPAAVPVCADQ